VLARHGLSLNIERLMDPTRVLVDVWDTPSHSPAERALLHLDEILSLLESRVAQSKAKTHDHNA